MKFLRRAFITLILIGPAVVDCVLAIAADAEPETAPSVGIDRFIVEVPTPVTPVGLEFLINVDGQRSTEAWTAYLGQLFDFLDRDRDGGLKGLELAHIPRPAMLLAIWRGDFDNLASDFARQDELLEKSSAESRLTRAAFAEFYQRSGLKLPELQIVKSSSASGDQTCRWLFAQLADNDGFVTQQSLAGAHQRLRAADENDDERWDISELNAADSARRIVQPTSDRNASTEAGMFQIRQGSQAGRADNRAAGNDPQAIATMLVSLNSQSSTPGVLALPEGEQPTALKWSAVSANGSTQVLRGIAGNLLLQVDVAAGLGRERFDFGRQSLLQQFESDDINHDQALDDRELRASPLAASFASLRALASRGNDQPVTFSELNSFLKLQEAAVRLRLVVSAVDVGVPLFQLLDTDNDGLMTLRELRYAWSQLSAWDANADGRLAWDELPRQYELSISQGPPNRRAITKRATAPKNSGPTWFLKMDRNGDHDLSPREFLGSAIDFRNLDQDHDGLISAVEARSP